MSPERHPQSQPETQSKPNPEKNTQELFLILSKLPEELQVVWDKQESENKEIANKKLDHLRFLSTLSPDQLNLFIELYSNKVNEIKTKSVEKDYKGELDKIFTEFKKTIETSIEARKLGMELLIIKGSKEAQALIDNVMSGSIDITMRKGQKTFVDTWNKQCPDIPMPCVPPNDFWYLTQLQNNRIIRNLNGEPQPSTPRFAENQFLWVDNWKEEDYNSREANESHRSQLLKSLLNREENPESTVNISREQIDETLWIGDPANRQPTKQHQEILKKLNVDPAKYELRLIRQDEYARSAKEKNWGQKNLWTNHDDYFLGGGNRGGLAGGDRDLGGPSDVGYDWRADAIGNLSVRLVLSRKQD